MSDRVISPIEFERIRINGLELVLYLSVYARSHVPAVFATSMEDGLAYPYGNLSVNLSSQGLVLPPWHISVKTWAENEELARVCQGSEVFERTEQSWALPFGSAQIWRLAPERMRALAVLQISRLMRWPLDARVLVELAARSANAGAGHIELEVQGLRVRACVSGDSGSLVFEPERGGDLSVSEQVRLDDALESRCFNLSVPLQGLIYRALGLDRSPPQTHDALLESAVQALASAQALERWPDVAQESTALARPRRPA
ncbi:MAG TPA: hypothetical protein VN259_07485 [Xanthomonadales bacterium]|nr:hypothetical protein [Xanthomonadales bacterium]